MNMRREHGVYNFKLYVKGEKTEEPPQGTSQWRMGAVDREENSERGAECNSGFPRLGV